MKNSAPKGRKGIDKERFKTTQSSSPDQIAVFMNGRGEVVTAIPVPGERPGSFDVDLARLPDNFDLSAALQLRRDSVPGLPPISSNTQVSTAIPDYSERTRILALDGETLTLNDADLSDWLLSAEKQIALGTDNLPVFETALEDTACSITRLPNGQVSMTEAPRQHVNRVRDRVEMMLGQGGPLALDNLTVETPLRSIARYFLNALPQGKNTLREGKELEVTAFLLITKLGFSYGLWSPLDGLFSEYAFHAPAEIQNLKDFGPELGFHENFLKKAQSGELGEAADQRSKSVALLEDYIRHAFDQLYMQLSPERLEQMELTCYTQVIWTADRGIAELVARIASEYSSRTGLDVFQINIPPDEAIASGLLYGSFDFGGDNQEAEKTVPKVDLAHDLLDEADSGAADRQNLEELMAKKKRAGAAFALMAAPVLALAVLLGAVANMVRAQGWIFVRDVSAEVKTAELKPALDRRKTYETNLKWYQEFIIQVSRLRKQQPVGIGLNYELDSRFPLNIDPSFYISDMKLAANGTVEIKGLAQNKDAITEFLKSMEFAGGQASGTKLFSNLTYEIQEGTPPPAPGQPSLPTTGRTALVPNLRPGVIAWKINGSYLPAVEFAPPDPTKKPPAAQPAPGATPTSGPLASPTAPAAR